MADRSEDQEFKPVSQEVSDLVTKTLSDIRGRSYSERHPELGRMMNCQVCNRRHREPQCQPRYHVLYTEEDPDTGETNDVLAVCQQQTLKGRIGATQFKHKRMKPRKR
jgi:hypothetical protein